MMPTSNTDDDDSSVSFSFYYLTDSQFISMFFFLVTMKKKKNPSARNQFKNQVVGTLRPLSSWTRRPLLDRKILTDTFYIYSTLWERICHVTIAPNKPGETASTRDGYTWPLRARRFHFQSTVNVEWSAEWQKLPACHRSTIFQLLEKKKKKREEPINIINKVHVKKTKKKTQRNN